MKTNKKYKSDIWLEFLRRVLLNIHYYKVAIPSLFERINKSKKRTIETLDGIKEDITKIDRRTALMVEEQFLIKRKKEA